MGIQGLEGRGYHHGRFCATALQAASRNLEEESAFRQLTVRAGARKLVSAMAAPYRHFPINEALLVRTFGGRFSTSCRSAITKPPRRMQANPTNRHHRRPPIRLSSPSPRAGAADVRRPLPNRDQFSRAEEKISRRHRSRDRFPALPIHALGWRCVAGFSWPGPSGAGDVIRSGPSPFGAPRAFLPAAEIILLSLFSHAGVTEPSLLPH